MPLSVSRQTTEVIHNKPRASLPTQTLNRLLGEARQLHTHQERYSMTSGMGIGTTAQRLQVQREVEKGASELQATLNASSGDVRALMDTQRKLELELGGLQRQSKPSPETQQRTRAVKAQLAEIKAEPALLIYREVSAMLSSMSGPTAWIPR